MSHRRSHLRAFSIERLESRMMMAADFGDAPTPYATTLAENGARHEAVGPQLGAARDAEDDGVHSPTASSDGADDDGVVFASMRAGQLGAHATVTVQGAPTGARLDAWIDFNGDGVWGGPGEQIANNKAVANGANTIEFDVPATAIAGSVAARFRLSTAGNLGTEGPAADGEVEDYMATIGRPVTAAGTFEAATPPVTTLADGAWSVAAADVDGDGDMDLLSASFNDNEIAWFENNGSETFTAHVIDTTATGARNVAAADVDGDGDMDILSASEGNGHLTWYENNGSQVFTTRAISTSASGARNLVPIDMDGDGDIDVVAAQGNRVAWYENNGAQTFTAHVLDVIATNTYGVAPADVDGDGDMDIVWSAVNDNKVAWYENNGIQTFTNHNISTTAMGARNIAAADVDGDGDLDVLSASAVDNRIAWYENDGNQTFASHDITTTASMAWSVFPADVDGDGDVDVLSASATDKTIALYKNNGSETFTKVSVSTAANGARGVIAADINGDGALDIASASSADDKIAWYANQVDNFTGDFNRDGRADGADFLLWQRALGNPATPPGSGADGNGDGFVDADDLSAWRNHFGSSATPASELIAGEESDGGSNSVAAAVRLADDFDGDAFIAADAMAAPAVAPSDAAAPANDASCEMAPAVRDAAFAAFGGASAPPRRGHGLATSMPATDLPVRLTPALSEILT